MAAKVGLFGGEEGTARDIPEAPKTLVSLEIWSTDGPGGGINGIRFIYVDVNDNSHIVPSANGVWGNKDTTVPPHQIPLDLDNDEHVTKLEGTVYSRDHVTSLKVTTTKGEYGWYGDTSSQGESFAVPLEKSTVLAFFARSDHKLNAVGVYVAPK